MSSGSSSPTSSSRRSGRKRNNSSSTYNNSAYPNPPQRVLGVAEPERPSMQNWMAEKLNLIGHLLGSNSSNMLFQNLNQGNQWSFQSGSSSPSFAYSLPSTTSPEYQPHKMMKFGDNNPNPGLTLTSNPSAPFSDAVMAHLQNQQREKDCVQEERDADWLTLSLGPSSRTGSEEANEDRELDLELKL